MREGTTATGSSQCRKKVSTVVNQFSPTKEATGGNTAWEKTIRAEGGKKGKNGANESE